MTSEIDKITRIKAVEIRIGDKFSLTLQNVDGSFRVTMRDNLVVSSKKRVHIQNSHH